MSLLKNYITAVKAENIKRKGTGTYWLCFSFGIFIPIIYFIYMLFSWEEDQKPVNIPYNFYQQNIGDMVPSFLSFFFPLLIIIIAAKITQIDHKNGGWQLMETQPLSKLSIYLSKLTILLVGNLIAIISFIGSLVFFFWFVSLLKTIPNNVTTDIPFGYLAQLTLRIFIAGLLLNIFQLVLSTVFRSFILPILVGFSAMLGSQILESFKIFRMEWNPFTILGKTATNPNGSQLRYFLLYNEKIAIVGFVILLIIGFIWYQNKTFKQIFIRPKSSIKVLITLVLGILGIALLIQPNTYQKHNRTLLSGIIESNEIIPKAYLIDPFINDTLAEINIEDNKFHSVIENEIPLEQYYLVFMASNQFFTKLYLSTKDSIYTEIQYFNNEVNLKTVKGTRLAENQYKSEANVMYGGWSHAKYIAGTNEYLERPEKVVNEIYKEWKNIFEQSDNFRTPDNYAPQSDFIQRNKKIATVEYLIAWNGFEERAKVVNPSIINDTPKKIQEIKKHISLEDNSLITNEEYFSYLMYELTKNDTTDIDLVSRQMRAISKIKNNDFKDRLLFGSLKNSLEKASNSQERKEFIQTYGNQISNPKLKRLAYNYFVAQEKLAKGNPAKNFIAQNLENQDVKLSDFVGKYVVIDVWATWCGPCKTESPHFEKVAIKNKNNPNIVFIALSIDHQKDNWFLEAKNKSKSVLQLNLSEEEAVIFKNNYSLESIPRFIFIDPEGNLIRAKMPSPSYYDYFEKSIDEELKAKV